ncbi:MAG: phage tail assembly protein [Sphingobium sp.]|nr:phage tail assembly protein [Sphingobium sp.]
MSGRAGAGTIHPPIIPKERLIMGTPETTAETSATTGVPVTRKMEKITLIEPIVRGETTITELTIRKPKSGELRGLSIQELMNSRIASTLDILPRITIPPITQVEADNLETEDMAAAAGVIIGFFMTEADKKKVQEVSKR